jgi:2-C-methyl-D-erythritol 4-phosphate cytidylyltransferase
VTTARPPIVVATDDVHRVTEATTSDVPLGDVRPSVWCIVVAGGSGARFGRPKQYELLGTERILDRSVRVATESCDGVVVVVPAADVEVESARFAHVVGGGSSRSESVRAGLATVPAEATVVCVHDAARPFATADLYGRVVAAIGAGADGAIPGLAVTDTIKVVDPNGAVIATPARESLRAVQTPQAFRADLLRRAHADGGEGTDDAALVEDSGGRVVVVDGEADNRKITHPEDLDWARSKVERLRQTGAER